MTYQLLYFCPEFLYILRNIESNFLQLMFLFLISFVKCNSNEKNYQKTLVQVYDINEKWKTKSHILPLKNPETTWIFADYGKKHCTFTLFSPLVAWSSMPLLALIATFFAWASFHFLSDSKS